MNIEDAKFIETKMRLLSKEQEAVISEFEKRLMKKFSIMYYVKKDSSYAFCN